eukprot:1179833-Prorocentrum_minimum.AAC.4
MALKSLGGIEGYLGDRDTATVFEQQHRPPRPPLPFLRRPLRLHHLQHLHELVGLTGGGEHSHEAAPQERPHLLPLPSLAHLAPLPLQQRLRRAPRHVRAAHLRARARGEHICDATHAAGEAANRGRCAPRVGSDRAGQVCGVSGPQSSVANRG